MLDQILRRGIAPRILNFGTT